MATEPRRLQHQSSLFNTCKRDTAGCSDENRMDFTLDVSEQESNGVLTLEVSLL